MTPRPSACAATGLVGPVALSGGLLLLLAAPLMRGGNRHVALIALEIVALAVLFALGWRLATIWRDGSVRLQPGGALTLLLLTPLLLALVQLVPVPGPLWLRLPGHDLYAQTLTAVGAAVSGWRPVSVSPDATRAALLAGIPLLAVFLLASLAALSQLRLMAWAVVAVAFAQVALGLLQVAGGQHSPLFFGVLTYGPPVGTFANRNHFGNYLAMALVAYVWLAYEATRHGAASRQRGAFGRPHRAAVWAFGGLVLVVGLLMSRSRGAALFGLPVALAALGVVSLRITGRSRGLRLAVPLALLLVVGSVALIGFDAVTSRLSGDQLASSAGFRSELARTSLAGALVFWPLGSGWGTYDLAYQRFQPASIAGYPNHAHHDYVEMLFEGGIVFVVAAAALAWLVAKRARRLVQLVRRDHRLDRDAMAAAVCGLGLLGFLLHSLVEFNMRIPANAMLATWLAAVYLRPLHSAPRAHDRPAQPHPSGR